MGQRQNVVLPQKKTRESCQVGEKVVVSEMEE